MALPSALLMRSTRALQPAATAVVAGTLYFVTDEGVLERSSGTAWQSYSGTNVAVHAPTHKSGGTDPIKLDELAAPTDVTTLNATTTEHGLLKKLSNVSTQFMNGVGNWAVPAGGASILTRLKLTDQTVTTSTVFVNDADLAFPIGASETWIVVAGLMFDAPVAADAKLTFTLPAGASSFWFGGPRFDTSLVPVFNAAATAISSVSTGTMGAGTWAGGVYMTSVVNSTTPGTVQLQWAQQASSGSTILKAGSFLLAFKL